MANRILLKRSSVANAAPQATDLEHGELAINYNTGALYFKNASNTVQILATTASATGPAGANTQIQFNDNSIFGGSAALTFNKTSNLLSATGNISASYFFGNGSQLTGISTNILANGTSSIDIPVANGNINLSVGGTPNVMVATSGGVAVVANVNAGAFIANVYVATKKTISDVLIMQEDIRAVSYGFTTIADGAFIVVPDSSTWHFTNVMLD